MCARSIASHRDIEMLTSRRAPNRDTKPLRNSSSPWRRGRRRDAFESTAGTGTQIPGPRISFGAGCVTGSAEAPFVMNREIRRPAGALHASSAARIGQGFAHLADRRRDKLPTEARIRGARVGRSGHQEHRQQTPSRKPHPVCHVASPADDPVSPAEGSIASWAYGAAAIPRLPRANFPCPRLRSASARGLRTAP
jgi:hypothetical protein